MLTHKTLVCYDKMLKPWPTVFPPDDNTRPHRANIVQRFLNDEGIERMVPWPACSPDISPIEHLWVKQFMRRLKFDLHIAHFPEIFKSNNLLSKMYNANLNQHSCKVTQNQRSVTLLLKWDCLFLICAISFNTPYHFFIIMCSAMHECIQLNFIWTW